MARRFYSRVETIRPLSSAKCQEELMRLGDNVMLSRLCELCRGQGDRGGCIGESRETPQGMSRNVVPVMPRYHTANSRITGH